MCSSNDLTSLINLINKELENLTSWFNANRLSLNSSKTNYMIFSNHKKEVSHPQLLINGKEITKVESTKFLGINIDKKLSWKQHTISVGKKLSSANFIIRHIRYKINQATALKLYDTLALPHLTYCNTVWGNCKKTHTMNIFRLQKRILRVCCDVKHLSTEALFDVTKKLPFYNIHKLQAAKTVHNFFHNIDILPSQIVNLFSKPSNVHCFNTRSLDNLCLFVHYGRLDVRKASLKIFAPHLWNKLPNVIRQINSFNSFKKNIKAFLQATPDF